MSNNISVQMTGLDELARDIERAADLAPNEFKKGMRKITREFMNDLKDEAAGTYQSTVHITSGFKMSPLKVSGDMMQMQFMPEAKGNQGHAWHLQEFGYELKRPTWKSRKKAIRNKNGGETLRFMPGNNLVDKILPEFEDGLEEAVMELTDSILERNNL